MAERVITEVGNNAEGTVVLILTIEEYELFKNACLELLDYYEVNRRKAKKVVRILEKLEKSRNKGKL